MAERRDSPRGRGRATEERTARGPASRPGTSTEHKYSTNAAARQQLELAVTPADFGSLFERRLYALQCIAQREPEHAAVLVGCYAEEEAQRAREEYHRARKAERAAQEHEAKVAWLTTMASHLRAGVARVDLIAMEVARLDDWQTRNIPEKIKHLGRWQLGRTVIDFGVGEIHAQGVVKPLTKRRRTYLGLVLLAAHHSARRSQLRAALDIHVSDHAFNEFEHELRKLGIEVRTQNGRTFLRGTVKRLS